MAWILCFVVLGACGASLLNSKKSAGWLEPEKVREEVVAASPVVIQPAPSTSRVSAAELLAKFHAQAAQPEPPEPTGPTLAQLNDPVWRAERIKELKVERYHASPAKDTEACQTIVKLLAAEGVGLDGVQSAYELAWENQTALRISSTMPAEEAAGIWRSIAGRALDQLRSEQPTLKEAVLEAIMQVQPTVFYGNPILDSAQPGQ